MERKWKKSIFNKYKIIIYFIGLRKMENTQDESKADGEDTEIILITPKKTPSTTKSFSGKL
jgi:hypothetical protein